MNTATDKASNVENFFATIIKAKKAGDKLDEVQLNRNRKAKTETSDSDKEEGQVCNLTAEQLLSNQVGEEDDFQIMELTGDEDAGRDGTPESTIRILMRSFYQIQKQRIQSGNRLCAVFRKKLGLNSSEKEDKVREAKVIMDRLRVEYDRVTDGVKKKLVAGVGVAAFTPKMKWKPNEVISSIAELTLIHTYQLQLEAEAQMKAAIVQELPNYSIWNNYLQYVDGIGPLMAAVLISEININVAKSTAALQKYAGLDVLILKDADGNEISREGRSMKAAHLVPKKFTKSDGTIVDTRGLSFNKTLKDMLLGRLAVSLIRANEYYHGVYTNNADRQRSKNMLLEESERITAGHIHRKALRYMTIRFLHDLWKVWRIDSGLPVRPEYAVAKLGLKHSGQTFLEYLIERGKPVENVDLNLDRHGFTEI